MMKAEPEYEVVWSGRSWRDVPPPEQPRPALSHGKTDIPQRVDTPDGWCVNFEPCDLVRRCRAPGCSLIAYYRVYAPTGRAIAGRWCRYCASRAMTRERKKWLQDGRRKSLADGPGASELG